MTTETSEGAPSGAPTFRKIAILGTAPLTRPLAPSPGGEWEVWSCGTPDAEIPSYDRFFEIHNPGFFREEVPKYWDWLHKVPCPVYTFHDIPTLQKPVRYPRAEIEGEFGSEFLTSSIAWMQALVVFELAPPPVRRALPGSAMGLWGVEMASDAEYAEQKSACIHWIKMARERGIAVVVPPESELLLTGKPYPDNVEDPAYRRLAQRKSLFAEQQAAVRNQIEALKLADARLEGQREEIKRFECTLITPV